MRGSQGHRPDHRLHLWCPSLSPVVAAKASLPFITIKMCPMVVWHQWQDIARGDNVPWLVFLSPFIYFRFLDVGSFFVNSFFVSLGLCSCSKLIGRFWLLQGGDVGWVPKHLLPPAPIRSVRLRFDWNLLILLCIACPNGPIHLFGRFKAKQKANTIFFLQGAPCSRCASHSTQTGPYT
jgi:hypothetical protein